MGVVQGTGNSVRASASRFKSNGDAAVDIRGSNTVTITGSGLHRVFPQKKHVPALSIKGGGHSQRVLVTGCDMEVSYDTAILCDDVESSNKTRCAGGSVMLMANFISKNQKRYQPLQRNLCLILLRKSNLFSCEPCWNGLLFSDPDVFVRVPKLLDLKFRICSFASFLSATSPTRACEDCVF